MKNGKKPTEAISDAVNAVKNNKKVYTVCLVSAAALPAAALIVLAVVGLSRMDFSTVSHISRAFWPTIVAVALAAAVPLFKALSVSKGYGSGDFPLKDSVSAEYIGKALDTVLPFKLGLPVTLRLYPEEHGFFGKICMLAASLLRDGFFFLCFLLFGGVFQMAANNYVSGDAVFSDYWLPVFVFSFALVAVLFVFLITVRRGREILKKFITTDRWITTLVFGATAWLLKFSVFVFSFAAFSNVGFLGSLVPAATATAVCSLFAVIPSTPAQLGLFELGVVFSFVASGFTPEQGLLAGLWSHGAVIVGVLIAAFFEWLLVGKKLLDAKNKEIADKKAAKAAEKETEKAEAAAAESTYIEVKTTAGENGNE